MRKKISADGIGPAGNSAADGSDRIAEKGREQKSTDLSLLKQITQGISAAVERQSTFMQQGETVRALLLP